MTKTFTIINNEPYAVKNLGYIIDTENDIRHYDFSLWHLKDSERDMNKALDSFYDLDGAALCEDENGELYAVENIYSSHTGRYEPMIWQKVKKA